MNYRFISLIFASIATMVSLFAEPVRVGMLNYELDSKQNTAKVVCCEITGDITIPEQIFVKDTLYTITSIGERAFCKDHHLMSITFPNSLISIEKEAFMDCSSLTRLILPPSIINLGNRAFADCLQLKEIYNLNVTPVLINTNIFNNVNLSRCILIVHPSAIASYKSAKGWQNFKNIYPLDVRQ